MIDTHKPFNPCSSDELQSLCSAMCDGRIDDAGLARLEDLLQTDADVRLRYALYMRMNGQLMYWFRPAATDQAEADVGSGEPWATEGRNNVAGRKRGFNPVGHPSFTVHYPLSTMDLSLGTVLISYVIAALIVAVGLTIAAAWKLPTALELAQQSALPAVAQRPGLPMEPVARLTGTAACRWADAERAPSVGDAIPLGGKLELLSGLAELTYLNGATVILEGPVTYEVESNRGGFLSLGKLTARLEKSEIRNPKSETISKSPNLQISKFVVRTPTAVVTDLGTEFGVEVSADQLTQVHVLRGSVETNTLAVAGSNAYRTLVTEGHAVRVGLREGKIETVAFAPTWFTRTLAAPSTNPAENAYIAAVLADKPLAYWPLNEPSRAASFRDRSGHGFHGSAMYKVACERSGPFGANTCAVALDGHGYIDVGRHDEFALKNDFTVEAWVRVGRMKPWGCVISAADQERFVGWGLSATPSATDNGKPSEAIISFVGWCVKEYDFSIPLAEVPANRWVHLAVAFDRSNAAHLYINGEQRGSIAGDKPAKSGPAWVQIGCDIPMEHCWRGGLAHVAVYSRVLTQQQIQDHYHQRSNTNAVTEK